MNGFRTESADTRNDRRLANALGWFSIGLGAAEVLAPGGLMEMIGISDHDKFSRSLVRFHGARELALGVGILAQPKAAGWIWGRAAGDLIDLASLGAACTSSGSDGKKLAGAAAVVLTVAALDVICAKELSRTSETGGKAADDSVRMIRTVTINRSPEEVYAFWRDFEQLPVFMKHLRSVRITGDKQSHWIAKAPAGRTVEWDAEIVEDLPNQKISWRSLDGSEVENTGTVHFDRATGGRGTVVRVLLDYSPPGGAIAASLVKLFVEDPEKQVYEDLHILKQILETGEVVKSDASIHCTIHAAQPAEGAL